ncbi:MAG: 50S ribosomal protein L30 [Bdellovibrionales bacterium]|nr:50S ribosomal protein L30 [Bdellovibrionales bacterium]
MAKSFRVKLIKSTIGCTQTQKDTVRCLGLRKTNSEAVVADNPANRGQIFKVQHLLEVTPEN